MDFVLLFNLNCFLDFIGMFGRENGKCWYFIYDILMVLEEFCFIRVFGLGILVVLFYGVIFGFMLFVNKVGRVCLF